MSCMQGSVWWTGAVVGLGSSMATCPVCRWWRGFAQTGTSTYSGMLTTPRKLSTRFWADGRSWGLRPTSFPWTCNSSPCFNYDISIFRILSSVHPIDTDIHLITALNDQRLRIMLNDHEAVVWTYMRMLNIVHCWGKIILEWYWACQCEHPLRTCYLWGTFLAQRQHYVLECDIVLIQWFSLR